MKSLRSRNGFTLLELLIVIGLMAVVSTLGVRAFFLVSSLWCDVERAAELDQTAEESIFAGMRKDFNEILPPEVVGQALVGTRGDVKNNEMFYGVALADDAVVFPVRVIDADTGRELALSVMYRINRPTGRLLRTTGPLGDPAPIAEETKVADGAIGFCVEYPGENGWVREWKSEALPQAVRVSVTLMRPGNPFIQVARKSIFPLHVE